MRQAAGALLSGYPHFTSVNGTAEATSLPRDSVDWVTAGQAFHWFDRDKAKVEFQRILRPGGLVILVWNGHCFDGSLFMSAYECMFIKYDADYRPFDVESAIERLSGSSVARWRFARSATSSASILPG